MSISTKPEPIVEISGQYEFVSTPVAFRPSKRHPWRSYEAGNRVYRRDPLHFYTTLDQTHHLVLYIRESRVVGFEYETHCSQCGAYTIVILPPDWKPAPVSALCYECMARGTSPDLPQDVTKYYTPEYQAAQRRAMGAR